MKKLMATLLSLCLLATLFPTAALAAEGETVGNETATSTETSTASITGLSIAVGDNTYGTAENGNIWAYIPSDVQITNCTITATANGPVTPTVNTEPIIGDLYVSSVGTNSATLNFNLMVQDQNLNQAPYALTVTSENGTSWEGQFGSGFSGIALSQVAAMLGDQLRLAPYSMNGASPAQTILLNQDNGNVFVVLCAPTATVHTVTYVVGNNSYQWNLPNGMTVPGPNYADNWYTDESYTASLTNDIKVTGDMTIYGTMNGSATSDFLDDLTNHRTATIQTLDDWEAFVSNAEAAVEDQLVILGDNINCNGKTYTPLNFKGNFNGNNKTISNAKFSSVLSAYTTSSESDIYCSGMFAAIGPGQIIANLKLDNVEAKYSATYAGVLAGLADGTSSNRALIQNVQVTDSKASGRTAAGVVGFIRNTDVKFCSSRSTTITGLANGGGVVGINNAKVMYCYSTSSPTALSSALGGSKGGVVSKKVRGGFAQFCWSTMDPVVGKSDGGGTDSNLLLVNNDVYESDFEAAGFTGTYWALADGSDTTFKQDAITFTFPTTP